MLRMNNATHPMFSSPPTSSPHQTKALQQWSSSLSLTGFAKVGYPGVVYALGESSCIEEFVVDNVKAMKWLALKVRFPLASPFPNFEGEREARKTKEVEARINRTGFTRYCNHMIEIFGSQVVTKNDVVPGLRSAALMASLSADTAGRGQFCGAQNPCRIHSPS
jgi:hypothetical protein